MKTPVHVGGTALSNGLRDLVTRFEQQVAPGRPLLVYLAGGMAVHPG